MSAADALKGYWAERTPKERLLLCAAGGVLAAAILYLAILEPALAARKQCTPAQLALAWLLHRGDDIVPIPGTKSRARLEENAAAASVSLTAADLAALDAALPLGSAEGGRYPEAMKPHWD